MYAANSTPWGFPRDKNPTTETIIEAIGFEDEDGNRHGLIWPNNEATTSYVAAPAGTGWKLSILYCGQLDWYRPVPNFADLIIAMRDIAPIWQWERRVPGEWPPRIYMELE